MIRRIGERLSFFRVVRYGTMNAVFPNEKGDYTVIEFVKGPVAYVCAEYITLDVSGVGYKVHVPNPFFYREQDESIVYTHHYVREDQQTLYGFRSRRERELFNKLLSVNGIGPKGALAIVASGDMDALIDAIETENEKYLTKFPGVGKKTAKQMALDLKGKLSELAPDYVPQTGLFAQGASELDEACEALVALGYSEREITRVRKELSAEILTTDAYIKRALQLLLK